MRVKRTSKATIGIAAKLDGWQPGLVAVLFAFGAAILVVPRPVAPRDVPEPFVTEQAVTELRMEEARRAEAARAALAPGVRALGAALRDLGRAEVSGDGRSLASARSTIASRLAAIAPEDRPQLLLLRAYQAEAFTLALRGWEARGEASRDFVELGGNLVEAFRTAGWCVDRGGDRTILLSDDELGVVFRKRWNSILSLEGPAIVPTLTEERLLFAFTVRHPRGEARGDARAIATSGTPSMLRRIDQYARLDPAYPASFARGVVLFSAGQYARSAQAFQAHIDAHPEGPLTPRAHNHVRAALAAEIGDDPNPSWFSL